MDTNGHITLCEDYVSFEVAKLLKEKGFNESTNRYYNAQYDEIRTVSDIFMMHWNDEEYMKRLMMEGAIAIPTLQMACKWLREVYNIHIIVFRYDNSAFPYIWYIFGHNKEKPQKANSYEEAVGEALKYTLENLI